MKVGDLVGYLEPGIEIVVARGIVSDIEAGLVRVFWDTGAHNWNTVECIKILNRTMTADRIELINESRDDACWRHSKSKVALVA